MKIFVLKDKTEETYKYYTTLVALYADKKDVLGVSLSTLQHIDFSFDIYDDEKFRIERCECKKKSDIIREKNIYL